MKCEVWSGKSAVGSVECEECSGKCEGRSGASNVTCETGRHFRRVHARTPLSQSARTHGLGWRTAHTSCIDEKGLLYIPKATFAPPRAAYIYIDIYIFYIYIFTSNIYIYFKYIYINLYFFIFIYIYQFIYIYMCVYVTLYIYIYLSKFIYISQFIFISI